MPAIGHWDAWAERSLNWKPSVEFMYPFGRDHAAAFAPLEPLFAELGALRGVEVLPLDWMRTTWMLLGFVSALDLSWLDVETFHGKAAPRLRRVESRTVRLGGLDLTDDGRVVLRVEDGGLFREARKEAAFGLQRADDVLKAQLTPDGDPYEPTIDIAYLDANASEGEVVQAIDPYRSLDLGEVRVQKLMLGRAVMQPQAHYAFLDIFIEIPIADSQRAGARS